MIGVNEDDRQYRRGMVLGLTMAEIMLLLIFLLLLLLSAKLLADQKLVAEAQHARDEAVAAKTAIEEKYDALVKTLGPEKLKGKSIYEIIDEWQKAEKKLQEKETELEEAISAMELLEPVKKKNPEMNNEQAKAEVERKVKVADEIEQRAAAMSPGKDPKAALDHFQKAAQIGDQALKSGQSPEQLLAGASCQKNLQQCQASNGDLAEQLARARGTLPSCWIDLMTGRPQYIFTANLRNDGIYLYDNKLTDRAVDQAKLPIAPLQFGRAYQPGEFIQAGQPIYQWSDSHDCRFYVRLIDETSNDKGFYRALKERGVERVFFTLPVN